MLADLAVLGLVVTLMCAVADPPPVPAALDAEDPALQVMSFNIRYGTADDGPNAWPHRRALVIETMRAEAPDVIGLQEALRFQLDEVLEALPGYTSVGVGRDDGAEAGEYAAILVRRDRLTVTDEGTFWLSGTPDVPGSRTFGNTLPRICTWAQLRDQRTGHVIRVFNVHLDHRSEPSRRESATLLAERAGAVDPTEAVILLGDLNADEESPTVRTLISPPAALIAERPLRDTFRVIHPDATEVGTAPGFTDRRTGPKIDYILVDDRFAVRDAAIIRPEEADVHPSDHYPVRARVVVRDE